MGMEDRYARLSRPAGRRSRGELGFSLIEVLIAAGILLIVALGVLPLFTQAIVNNRAGADYTQATNYAKSELERLYALPFSSPDLQVTTGSEQVTVQYFSQTQQKWITGTPPVTETPVWTRTTTIRQYDLGGLVDIDKDGKLDNPLPAGTPQSAIHAKEIEVLVESGRGGGPLGMGKKIDLKVLKAY